MHLLAIDTSTEHCSVAVRRDHDGEVFARQVLAGQKHSLLLLPMIDEVLRESGLRLAQIGGIAYGEGPGSFTGLRIACSVVQGIAAAHGAQVLGVSTLASVAEQARTLHLVRGGIEQHGQQQDGCYWVVALDARMGEVYYAPLQWQAPYQWRLLEPVRVCAPTAVPALPVFSDSAAMPSWHGCGSGFAVHGVALQQAWGSALAGVLSSDSSPLVPEAGSILRLAMPALLAGQGLPAEQALPVYIRDRVALRSGERR
jgi:tRNA threonylcarbamoyladenosine biosynthesis protein TsaB